jgi:SAM-dependent methyltransferase
MVSSHACVFDRSGIAALSDLQAEEWKVAYSFLEKEQNEFLAKESRFRSPEYKWPRDPLHRWSRVWEYPYAYHHLKQWHANGKAEMMLHVVDLGSGVTFFPFSVARLGYDVTCVDTDPVVGVDLPRAASIIDHNPGHVDCRICDKPQLPFGDADADAVYCISVLEHVPHFEQTIGEISRILKPGGLFVLTIDLDMRGDGAIGTEDYARLTQCLKRSFNCYYAVATVHPRNVLTSCSGPFPARKRSLANFLLKEGVRRLMGRHPSHRIPFELTVEGLVLIRSP